MLQACKKILEDPTADSEIISGMVNLLLIIVTATDNINQNMLLEYFMQVDLFPCLIRVCQIIQLNVTVRLIDLCFWMIDYDSGKLFSKHKISGNGCSITIIILSEIRRPKSIFSIVLSSGC